MSAYALCIHSQGLSWWSGRRISWDLRNIYSEHHLAMPSNKDSWSYRLQSLRPKMSFIVSKKCPKRGAGVPIPVKPSATAVSQVKGAVTGAPQLCLNPFLQTFSLSPASTLLGSAFLRDTMECETWIHISLHHERAAQLRWATRTSWT